MSCLNYIVWYGQFVTNWYDFIETPFWSTQNSSFMLNLQSHNHFKLDNVILHTTLQSTHKGHPITHPHGRAMGCLWEFLENIDCIVTAPHCIMIIQWGVNFVQNPHNRHPIAHQWGHIISALDCYNLSANLLLSQECHSILLFFYVTVFILEINWKFQ